MIALILIVFKSYDPVNAVLDYILEVVCVDTQLPLSAHEFCEEF